MKSKNRTKFGLMRHAKTQWNLDKRIQGQNDSVLCAEGIEQARKWRPIVEGVRDWDRVVSSGLSRSIQTAEIVSRDLVLPVEQDSRLNEQDWGDWNGKTEKELIADHAGELERRMLMGWRFSPPGGEQRIAVLKRSKKALGDLAARHPGENILVVAHGGVIKCILYDLLNREFLPEEPQVLKQYHLHFLCWEEGNPVLEKLNAARLG